MFPNTEGHATPFTRHAAPQGFRPDTADRGQAFTLQAGSTCGLPFEPRRLAILYFAEWTYQHSGEVKPVEDI